MVAFLDVVSGINKEIARDLADSRFATTLLSTNTSLTNSVN